MERHELDALSLIGGLVFVAVAALGLTDALVLDLTDLRWVGPALLVVLGVTLVLTAGRGRAERRADAAPAFDTQESDPAVER